MYHVAISHHTAELFFGTPKNSIGKTLRYENKFDFVVSAVFENLTAQSSLQFDFLLNWEAQSKLLEWPSNDFKSFIELSPGADLRKINAEINRRIVEGIEKQPGVQYLFGLQPFGDQYLYVSLPMENPMVAELNMCASSAVSRSLFSSLPVSIS